MNMLETATRYHAAGLCALPARVAEKCPNVPSWSEYQDHPPTDQQRQQWFATATAICLIAGKVSGNLEVIDYDFQAELWDAWRALVEADAPGLLDRVVIESSQSGGKHVVYRCDSSVPGSLHLAQRNLPAPNADPIEYRGKRVTPRKIKGTDRYEATVTLIETRGEGGLFLCAPSPGYVLQSGLFEDLPVLTAAEREILIDAARALNEVLPPTVNAPPVTKQARPVGQTGDRPGDEYNQRGIDRDLLKRHGWSYVRGSDPEYWRRPGKTAGQSASILGGNLLYVFSSNCPPFEMGQSYSAFATYTLLEHDGDYQAAASALAANGFGKPSRVRDNSRPGLSDDEIDSLAASAGNSYDSIPDETIPNAEIQRAPKLKIRSAGELMREFVALRRVVIDGLLRIGEVMNVIAPPKFGKSWLVLSLVLAVACGLKWLGRFYTHQGKVLLIDNELHPETLANRLPRVAMAMGVEPEQYQDKIDVINLRGKLVDLKVLSHELMFLNAGDYDLIVLDAWYRLQPSGTDENANGDVTQLYNILESVSDRIGSAFVCIHHTSKGSQSDKAVTDVGSGAGAQARAADTHVVMRPHEVDGAVVVGASVRSWAPPDPFVMRFDFPVFYVDEFLNPADLKSAKPRKSALGGLNDKADADDPHRTQLLDAMRDHPEGATQSALRKATGFNGPKFLKLVQYLIKSGAVEYLPKEDTGARADIYKATDGLQVQTYARPDQKNQTYCADTQSVYGSGLAPYRGPDLDPVSDPGDLPRLEDCDVFRNGDLN